MPHYRISFLPTQQRIEVQLSFTTDQPEVSLQLPAWTPGSYLIRDFAQHHGNLIAHANGVALSCHKIDKHSYRLTLPPTTPATQTVEVHYQVFAADNSVRGVDVSGDGGFINPAALLWRVCGQEQLPHHLTLEAPANSNWQLATTLPAEEVAANGFGRYCAPDYPRLIDHPLLFGSLQGLDYTIANTPHSLVMAHQPDHPPRYAAPRLTIDLARLVATHIDFWGGGPPPFPHYQFLLRLREGEYGGLEHSDCSALVSSESDLPGEGDLTLAQQGFYGLCSHEYFHAWWVKRIRPQVFLHYQLEAEAYTPLLWMFEGFTSYYDNLLLWRAGLINHKTYLKLLGDDINRHLRTTGWQKQSLAESSFDSWIKYYRPSPDAINSQTSYYRHGALLALVLDATLRRQTGSSLGDVLRHAWRCYQQEGEASAAVADAGEWLKRFSGVEWGDFLTTYVEGCAALPLAESLAFFGVKLVRTEDKLTLGLGFKNGEEWEVNQVWAGSAAARAGVVVGDQLVALDGWELRHQRLPDVLERYRAGEKLRLHYFRNRRLREAEVELISPGWRYSLEGGEGLAPW